MGCLQTHKATVVDEAAAMDPYHNMIEEMQSTDFDMLEYALVPRPSTTRGPMTITAVKDRPPELIASLVEVWESSVRATHYFLSNAEVEAIKGYVPGFIADIPVLLAAKDSDGNALAFMGIDDERLEMLFVLADERGKGLGRALLETGICEYGVRELTVNEQNPSSVGFYEHMGFETYKRTELDEEGNPYPLLYMKLRS